MSTSYEERRRKAQAAAPRDNKAKVAAAAALVALLVLAAVWTNPWHWTFYSRLAQVTDGEPTPLDEHDAVRWLAPDELDDVPWLPADRVIVGAIVADW